MKLYYADVVPNVTLGDVVKIHGTHVHPPANTTDPKKGNDRYNSTIIFPEREQCCKATICQPDDQDSVQCKDSVGNRIAKAGVALSLDDFFDERGSHSEFDTAVVVMLVCVVKIGPEMPGRYSLFHCMRRN